MNGPREETCLGDVEDFKEACATHAWFFSEGWIDLQTAVDNLQHLAERWGLVDEPGQDEVQRLIAYDDAIDKPVKLSEYETGYIQRIVAQWDAADTARPTAKESFRGGRILAEHIPASTVDAFDYVVSLGDREQLTRWLRDHSDLARELLKKVAA